MQTRRILIVDDAPEFANLVKDALSTIDMPLQVTVYYSGEEAWLEALKTRFDLVITDLRLPGISGTELVRRIRARFPRIKIIAVSGLEEAGLNERTRAAGVDVFYRKPVEIPLLLTKIENLLSDMSHDLETEDKAPKPPSSSRLVTMPLTPQPDLEQPKPTLKSAQYEPITRPAPSARPASATPQESSKSASKNSPDDMTIMRDMEQRLIKLMKDCDAEGVAISTVTGQILFQNGTAEKFKLTNTLITACANLINTLKKTDRESLEITSLGLMAFSGPAADIFMSNISKFFIWLIFPPGVQPNEAAKATTALYTSRDSLQFIFNMVSQIQVSVIPHSSTGEEELPKGTGKPMHTDDLKMPQEYG